MYRYFKYRLYPTPNQCRELEIQLETHRRLYNAALEQRQLAYKTRRLALSFFDQSKQLKELRATDPYQNRTNAGSQQGTLLRLDRAFKAFFTRVKCGQKTGYPRFKSKGQINSIDFTTYGSGIKIKGKKLYIQHVGNLKLVLHRPVKGKIKTATVKREGEKWYVLFACDLGPICFVSNGLSSVGLDIGLESFLTLSNGETVENPKFLKKSLPKLKRLQRKVSRCKLKGRNRQKAKQRLTATHNTIKNQRKDFHHKISSNLIRRFGLIGVERLTISNMVKNHSLAQSISDAGWGNFISMLQYKAESAGCEVIEVNPSGTSQMCSKCGLIVKKPLSQRTHNCPSCGLSLHRDENAARNILARALQDRTDLVDLKNKRVLVQEKG